MSAGDELRIIRILSRRMWWVNTWLAVIMFWVGMSLLVNVLMHNY